MNATRIKRPSDNESTPQLPQATPQSVGYGAPDHSFTLQAIMELQKSVGQMNSTMEAMRQSVDSLKVKVDDLVGWKHKIVGGAAVLGLVFTCLGFLIGKASEYVTFKQIPPTVPAQPAPPVAPPVKADSGTKP